MQKLLVFLILAFFPVSFSLLAQQDIKPGDVKVSEMTDAQVRKIMTEMENRGMSEQEAMTLAAARGFTQTQIQELKKRIEELRTKETSASMESQMGDTTRLEVYTQKQKVLATQEEKRVFGFNFFNNQNLTFEPGINLPVSPSYVLGPGDELLIDIWGASQQSYQLYIGTTGAINIPIAGPVALSGLTLQEGKKKVLDKLTLIYRDLASAQPNTFANISIGQIRPINVNVVGEVFNPGTYTLPGTASAFNALYLSGGPNFNGSFRDIRIIRDGRVVSSMDVYKYLIDGQSGENVPLRDGDVLMVPSYNQRVRLAGEFKRTGIFEGKPEETVADMVRYAGGFTDAAYTHRLEMFRNDSRQQTFKGVSMEEFNRIHIQNGDSLHAGEIIDRIENRVILEGAVRRPGNYELKPGLMLSELIREAEGVREDAFLQRALVLRLNEDLSFQNISFDVRKLLVGEYDLKMQREDVVSISAINDMRQDRVVEIKGEVLKPGIFAYREGLSLSDLVSIAGGFKEAASNSYIEVSRRLNHEEASEYSNQVGHLFQFSISRDLSLEANDSEFELNPFDQVFVRRAPGFTETGSITINGEVKYAGQYSLNSRKERISEIIQRAGGLTADAYPKGAMFTRKKIVSPKIMRLRQELVKRDSTLSFSDMGFDVVGVDLETALKNPGGREDIYLREGDELIIPRKLQTVEVSGEVLNPLSTPFVEGRTLRYYVNQGGGFSLQAKKTKAYVVYANGTASATKGFLFFNNYPKVVPGSQIVVPEKAERERLPASAWISIGSSVSSLALTIITIVNATK